MNSFTDRMVCWRYHILPQLFFLLFPCLVPGFLSNLWLWTSPGALETLISPLSSFSSEPSGFRVGQLGEHQETQWYKNRELFSSSIWLSVISPHTKAHLTQPWVWYSVGSTRRGFSCLNWEPSLWRALNCGHLPLSEATALTKVLSWCISSQAVLSSLFR